MRVVDLLNRFKTYIDYNTQDEKFANALRAISEFAISEQTVIRKDNNKNINRKDTEGKNINLETRDHDKYGNPQPLKDENVIKYRYDKESFVIINNFIKKIKFNSKPKIGKSKRVMIVYDNGRNKPLYSSNKSHEIESEFERKIEYTDIIYLMDKIKDSMMHANNGETNYEFEDDYTQIHIVQSSEDYEIDCKIKIEDLIDFISDINSKYGIKKTASQIDMHAYSYLIMLMYNNKEKYPILLNKYTYGIDFNIYSEEYIKHAEKIVGILLNINDNPPCYYSSGGLWELVTSDSNQTVLKYGIWGLLNGDNIRLKQQLLSRNCNNNNIIWKGIIKDIAELNGVICEYLRHSRSHLNYINMNESGYLQFSNSLKNSSLTGFGENDVPKFMMLGDEPSYKILFDQITSSNITFESLYYDLTNNIFSDNLRNWYYQLHQLLINFARYQNVTEIDIKDDNLRERYIRVGTYAREFIEEMKIFSNHEFSQVEPTSTLAK